MKYRLIQTSLDEYVIQQQHDDLMDKDIWIAHSGYGTDINAAHKRIKALRDAEERRKLSIEVKKVIE